MNNLSCPRCGLSHIKRNGHTHYGKQNHRCKDCDRQFVADSQHISEAERELIGKLLLERISLSGVCRVMGVSLRWLLDFVAELYESLPDDLNLQLPESPDRCIKLLCLEAEADEMWCFVGSKANRQWVWVAIETETRQVLAFHVGDRSRRSARRLWNKIPTVYRRHATFDTDGWGAYKGLIPGARHRVRDKALGPNGAVERFNCTLRQRVSRLARETLSFSKSLCNHIGAIQHFICYYNLEVRGFL